MPEIPSSLGVFQPWANPARSLSAPRIDENLAAQPAANVAYAAKELGSGLGHLGESMNQRDMLLRQMDGKVQADLLSFSTSEKANQDIQAMQAGQLTPGQLHPDIQKAYPTLDPSAPIPPEAWDRVAMSILDQGQKDGMQAVGEKAGVYGQSHFLPAYDFKASTIYDRVHAVQLKALEGKHAIQYGQINSNMLADYSQGNITEQQLDEQHASLIENHGKFFLSPSQLATEETNFLHDKVTLPFRDMVDTQPDVFIKAYREGTLGRLNGYPNEKEALYDKAISNQNHLTSESDHAQLRSDKANKVQGENMLKDIYTLALQGKPVPPYMVDALHNNVGVSAPEFKEVLTDLKTKHDEGGPGDGLVLNASKAQLLTDRDAISDSAIMRNDKLNLKQKKELFEFKHRPMEADPQHQLYLSQYDHELGLNHFLLKYQPFQLQAAADGKLEFERRILEAKKSGKPYDEDKIYREVIGGVRKRLNLGKQPGTSGFNPGAGASNLSPVTGQPELDSE